MTCPVCFSEDTNSISTYTAEEYSFNKCNDCNVIFANPMKAGTKKWYENQEFYQSRSEPKKKLTWYETTFLQRTVNSTKNGIILFPNEKID